MIPISRRKDNVGDSADHLDFRIVLAFQAERIGGHPRIALGTFRRRWEAIAFVENFAVRFFSHSIISTNIQKLGHDAEITSAGFRQASHSACLAAAVCSKMKRFRSRSLAMKPALSLRSPLACKLAAIENIQ